jgi:TonB family protein
MKRSDSALMFAFCVSLIVHAGLGMLMLREQLAWLASRSAAQARVDAAEERIDPAAARELEEPQAVVLQPAPEILPEFRPLASPPRVAKKKPDTNDENIEWGERDAKGFAITSAPGKAPMTARKGVEDQSSASRDPEGPQPFPDEPSLSTVPPGENGDGRKPMRDALAGKGTEGNPADVLSKPQIAVTPPPPIQERTALASADNPISAPQTSGRSTSLMPAAERRSPAQGNSPPAAREDLPNDPATGQETQILPIKRIDVIGIRSNKPAYPEVVLALTQPPGVRMTPQRSDPFVAPVLPNIARAEESGSPSVQPATAALQLRPTVIEEMAQRLGETDPLSGPAIVEALTRPPGEDLLEGGASPLPEIALADQPSAAPTQDAIVALTMEAPRPEEPAQQFQPADAPVVTSQQPTGSAASATGGAVGPPAAAADPAPDTGFESDPFAKIPGVEFHNGKVEARSGRQIKPIRPRLSEAGMRDLLAQQFPTVLLKVRIDKSGKVVDVHIIQGSGSEAVDMPVYRALWGWWFEPPKDKKGNPLEDVQLVAIHWG